MGHAVHLVGLCREVEGKAHNWGTVRPRQLCGVDTEWCWHLSKASGSSVAGWSPPWSWGCALYDPQCSKAAVSLQGLLAGGGRAGGEGDW